MTHSFHVAKLSTLISANWTSHYGVCQATAFPTRPFLTLRLGLSEIGWRDLPFGFKHILFLVSRQKPPGENTHHYFTLGSDFNQKSRLLCVEPPLNSGDSSLYLHTCPHIPDASQSSNVTPLAHRLNAESFTFFRETVIAHMDQYAGEQRDNYLRIADDSSREYRKPRSACVFDITVQDGARILEKQEVSSLTERPSIYKEIAIFEQLCADYSWPGIDLTVTWASAHCQYYLENGFPRTSPVLPVSTYTGMYPTFNDDVKTNALILHSMVIPHNGNPRVPKGDNDEEFFDWDEGPDDGLEDVPPNQPAV
ncbi:hypothetical protein BU17DRAFT_94643 [Hysterangium stoloniferum]|nr:hypothetical protein BU17DRAFT_94643 [Hysterangium stoloniferum]